MDVPNDAFAVILAGGGGTRLWPKSRKKHPKHLLNLVGDKSLLELTYERLEGIIPNERVLVITHKDHAQEVRDQLPKLPSENFIIEPEAKNTALAMGTASAFIHARNPNAAVIFLAADHIFTKLDRFQMNAIASLNVALSGDVIVSIGIRPSFPHTGLGYIKVGEEREDLSKVAEKGFVFKVKEFKEKPNLVTAQSFLASGQYLWNANLYTWGTRTIFKAFEKHSPKIFKAISKIAENPSNSRLPEIYDEVGDVNSIDYEISEKVDNIVVIPGDFGWSDIGDWKVVYDTLGKDNSGNAVVDLSENYIGVDTKNSLVETKDRLVVTVGVENLVIVDTGDAILICDKDKTQDVKKVVEKLKEKKLEKYL